MTHFSEKANKEGIIDTLIDTLIQQKPINAEKIFVTGMSNGTMMPPM